MASLAEAKYARESLLQAERGTIVDRNGELIAADTLSYRLIAVLAEKATLKDSKKPRHVDDPKKQQKFLRKYIPLEKEEYLELTK